MDYAVAREEWRMVISNKEIMGADLFSGCLFQPS
jgi:hypothetical protein